MISLATVTLNKINDSPCSEGGKCSDFCELQIFSENFYPDLFLVSYPSPSPRPDPIWGMINNTNWFEFEKNMKILDFLAIFKKMV